MLTAQQKKDRCLGIGGSDMPIILGLSNYKTPYELFLEKIGDIDSDYKETQEQYWGNVLEDIIVNEFKRRNNVEVEMPDTQIHPFHEYLRTNLDGFIPEWNAVLEAKSSSAFMAQDWGADGSDVIPLSYLVQVAHYCIVTNAERAHIAVLIGGNDYREFKYERDKALEDRLIDAAKEFWAAVQSKRPPNPININDLKLMYPSHKPEKLISADVEHEGLVSELRCLKEQMKELQELEEKHKFSLMNYMQDAECLTNPDGKPLVTWKTNRRGNRSFLIKAA